MTSNPTTHRQWSSCRMVFHENPNYPSGLVKRRDSAQIGIENPDVINVTIHKDLTQAAGGFTATLVPRQDYLNNISPNDWVEIFLDNGDGDKDSKKEPVMVGLVDTISRRRKVTPQGATTEVISITGRDYGKVLLSIQLIVDPLIGAIIDQTTFESEVIVAKGSDSKTLTEPANKIIAALVKKYHDKRAQCVTPGSVLFALGQRTKATVESGLVLELQPTQGNCVLTFNANLSGNLWATMESYTHPLLNEFYVDTIHGVPTLVLEERPYSNDPFSGLEGFPIVATEITDEDIGKGDQDTRNWFRVYPDAAWLPHEAIDAEGIGYINQTSMARAGLRKLDPTTTQFGDFNRPLVSTDGYDRGLLQDWSGLLAEWNAHNDLLLSGPMTSRLRPDAKIGRRFDYTNPRTNERLSFYIEAVTHNYVYPGASTTSYRLSRGVERDTSGNFPFLKSIRELASEVQELKEGLALKKPEEGDFNSSGDGTAFA